MESREDTTLETIKEIRKKIVVYENQRYLADQKLSIVRQQHEDINHFFISYGYQNEFNVVTQTTANERVKRERSNAKAEEVHAKTWRGLGARARPWAQSGALKPQAEPKADRNLLGELN